MKTIRVMITLLFIIGCMPINTPFDLAQRTPVAVTESFISLQSGTPLLGRFGSAVIVGDGLAVTNRHVVEGVPGMVGHMAGGIRVSIENAILSDRLDLAVLPIPCGIGRPMKTGPRVRKGDRIFSAGTSVGATFIVGDVISAEIRTHHESIRLPEAETDKGEDKSVTSGFLYAGDTAHGFSGGPVVTARGELVGINHGKVLRFLSEDDDMPSYPVRTYGLAYHIQDVLGEIERISPGKGDRCVHSTTGPER